MTGHNIQIGAAGGDVVILMYRPDYRLEFLSPVPLDELRIPSHQRKPSYLLDPQRQIVPSVLGWKSKASSRPGAMSWKSQSRCGSFMGRAIRAKHG